ncbi:hypothetical protein JIX56_47115 [Streptomyces sp. CA-210063]|uniref:hypothetical protein n=1 Tax=Streptomyces sp. CA-210063 TaxID=2801029 RepID=UPI00214CE3E2|nr:hypothetical protein [Streptomyces sp. CA-210063]UUU37454.1 hypothetical protein JIX56_47115 [Streptomyces sp. CA-210063]
MDEAAGEVPVSVDRSGAGSPVGVRLVPQWEPGGEADVLPRSYRDVVEVLQDAVHPMRAHHLCAALGLSTDKNKVEGFRSKLSLTLSGILGLTRSTAQGSPGFQPR